MVVAAREEDVAHLRLAVGVVFACPACAGETERDQVAADRESGELLDRVGDRAQPVRHGPLVGQEKRRAAGTDRGGIGHGDPDDRTADASEGIDDRGSILGGVGDRIPNRDLAAEYTGKLVEDLDRLYATLTVADDHRPHAVALVVPGEHSRQLRTVLIWTV